MSTTQPTLNETLYDVSLSRMTEHDLLEVVEIEERSGLSQWGWGAYYAELQGPNRDLMFVARLGHFQPGVRTDCIAGYIVARLIAAELHINNVAVREDVRRRGIGSSLLRQVIGEGKRQTAKTAFLEVRSGNLAAQALYEKCGFRKIAKRGSYYSAPVEDALVMSLSL